MKNRPRRILGPETADTPQLCCAVRWMPRQLAAGYLTLKLHFTVYGVLIVLFDTEIPHGNPNGGMV